MIINSLQDLKNKVLGNKKVSISIGFVAVCIFSLLGYLYLSYEKNQLQVIFPFESNKKFGREFSIYFSNTSSGSLLNNEAVANSFYINDQKVQPGIAKQFYNSYSLDRTIRIVFPQNGLIHNSEKENADIQLKNGDQIRLSARDYNKYLEVNNPENPHKFKKDYILEYTDDTYLKLQSFSDYKTRDVTLELIGNKDNRFNPEKDMKIFSYTNEKFNFYCSDFSGTDPGSLKIHNIETKTIDKKSSLYSFHIKDDLPVKNTCLFASINNTLTKISYIHIPNPSSKVTLSDEFDPDLNFDSQITMDFSTDLYEDKGEVNSKEYMDNRKSKKKDFLAKLQITPKVDIDVEKLVFYKNQAIITLPLSPKTPYNIRLKNLQDIHGQVYPDDDFKIETGDSQHLSIRPVGDKVSLYTSKNIPKFKILNYNTGKENFTIKVCSVDLEKYAMLERFSKYGTFEYADSFIDILNDKKGTYECKEKEVTTKKQTLTEFEVKDLLSTGLSNGYYFVSFKAKEDMVMFKKLSKPILFGIIDSHITMKISRSGKTLFFVNNLETLVPVMGQVIKVYKNSGDLFSKKYNESSRAYDFSYYGLDRKNYEEPITLGTTNKDGFLEVNIDDKLKEKGYDLTFENWYQESETGKYNSFFVTASSKDHFSGLVSTWNDGIANWNFGFSANQYEYNDCWGNCSGNTLYSAYVYPDRNLYLPGETINIKTIIRNANDQLTIPGKGEDFLLRLFDSNGKEISNKIFQVNDFGSYVHSYSLADSASLGSYRLEIFSTKKGVEQYVTSTNFNVEVFKNPSFHTEISLKTKGLAGDYAKVMEEDNTGADSRWVKKIYKGQFDIEGTIGSKFYNGATLANIPFQYKVFKQPYYENTYWGDCYYGCYGEESKIFYTEGDGMLDTNGKANLNIPVDFESTYDDYKYIVEVTVKDPATLEEITSANSLIAKLPNEFKVYNPSNSVDFSSNKLFAKTGDDFEFTSFLKTGKWSSFYDGKYILDIYKRIYKNEEVFDVKGYMKKVMTFEDQKVESIDISSKKDWKEENGNLVLNKKFSESGEYIIYLKEHLSESGTTNSDTTKIEKEGVSLYVFDDKESNVPVIDDNKIRVISEKVSYKLGEKARILVRLPFSNGKVLLTTEKSGIIDKKYIDVVGNTFFHEFTIDSSYMPNAYIGVVALDRFSSEKIPEYKVGYTEIVVDKSEKMAQISVDGLKKEYKPKDQVTLNMTVKDKHGNPLKSELSVMIIDDSLISLMGNIDLDILPKFYQKAPFQISTSLTNLGMLKNYYFSRRGVAGGSGGDGKGGGSALSSRTLFKNTAYYNGNIITDAAGKANVTFTLPDNITNYRVIVISNGQKSHFGVSEDKMINVRKDVVVEDKMPFIIRDGDKIIVGANIFNNTDSKLDFKVSFEGQGFQILSDVQKNITIGAKESSFVTYKISANKDLSPQQLSYTIRAIGPTVDLSDSLTKSTPIVEDPILSRRISKNNIGESTNNLTFEIPGNTNLEKSYLEVSVSNTILSSLKEVVKSLMIYPYGCIEQSTSSTLPNTILLKFDTIFTGILSASEREKLTVNIVSGLKRIEGMQTVDGGFGYWPGETQSNLHITPFVLRSLIDMKNNGASVSGNMIKQAKVYLENNMNNAEDEDSKAEILWALKVANSSVKLDAVKVDTSKLHRHGKIAYVNFLLYKNDPKIGGLIEEIKSDLSKGDDNYYYWASDSDKALLTRILIKQDSPQDVVEPYIHDLYKLDLQSYYHSTQTKNNVFQAFTDYIQKYPGSDNVVALQIGPDTKEVTVGGDSPSLSSFTLPASGLVKNNAIDITFSGSKESKIYVKAVLIAYPTDLKQIKENSANGISVSREIYQVNRLPDDPNKYDYYDSNSITPSARPAKDLGDFNLIKGSTFKLGQLYKAKILLTFDADIKMRNNLVIEDYLPASFKVVNTAFDTVSSDIQQNTQNNWFFDHKENMADRIFLTSSYGYSNHSMEYEYYFKPEFAGTFTYPPVSSYLMYDPMVQGNSIYDVIEVK